MSGMGREIASCETQQWQSTATKASLPDVSDDAYSHVTEERATEILRQAELRHQALLAIAAAADNRAIQFLVAASALAAAATGAAAALGSTGSPTWVWLGLIGAAGSYIVAAGLAAWAARPEASYQPPGMAPDQFWYEGTLKLGNPDFKLMIISASHTAIWCAQATSQERGRWSQRALWAAAWAPIYLAGFRRRWPGPRVRPRDLGLWPAGCRRSDRRFSRRGFGHSDNLPECYVVCPYSPL
jgi:hypothetical protein